MALRFQYLNFVEPLLPAPAPPAVLGPVAELPEVGPTLTAHFPQHFDPIVPTTPLFLVAVTQPVAELPEGEVNTPAVGSVMLEVVVESLDPLDFIPEAQLPIRIPRFPIQPGPVNADLDDVPVVFVDLDRWDPRVSQPVFDHDRRAYLLPDRHFHPPFEETIPVAPDPPDVTLDDASLFRRYDVGKRQGPFFGHHWLINNHLHIIRPVTTVSALDGAIHCYTVVYKEIPIPE